MSITREDVDQYKEFEASGAKDVSLEELRQVYGWLESPRANSVFANEKAFVSFETIPKVEFRLDANQSDLSFISTLSSANPDTKKLNLIAFLKQEFLQDSRTTSWYSRLVTSLLPLVAVAALVISKGTHQTLNTAFQSILMGLAVFVAIFSVFTTTHSYLDRKKLDLYKSGRLSYFFSIDKNVTVLGVATILLALVGVVSTPEESSKLRLSFPSYDYIPFILFLLCFEMTFILLRTLIEFYVIRPGAFELGEMKKEFLETFE
jgi:hypothetical protein